MFARVLLSCAGIFLACNAAKLPPYIKPCRGSDPNINQCAKERSVEAIAQIIHGDKNFHLPNLEPFKLPEISLQAGDNLKLKLKQCVLTGLEKMVVEEANIDLKNKLIEVTCSNDLLNLVADSNINGRILVLPIHGDGPCNITFVGGTYKYSFRYDLMNKKGKEYASIKDAVVTFTVKRAYLHFDNLFNGNKALGDEMNHFLNENWQDVTKDFGPAITDTIKSIITSIISSYFNKVPFNELFLP